MLEDLGTRVENCAGNNAAELQEGEDKRIENKKKKKVLKEQAIAMASASKAYLHKRCAGLHTRYSAEERVRRERV